VGDDIFYLLVCVDDILLIGSDSVLLHRSMDLVAELGV
jgi:hypothetical protein